MQVYVLDSCRLPSESDSIPTQYEAGGVVTLNTTESANLCQMSESPTLRHRMTLILPLEVFKATLHSEPALCGRRTCGP